MLHGLLEDLESVRYTFGLGILLGPGHYALFPAEAINIRSWHLTIRTTPDVEVQLLLIR